MHHSVSTNALDTKYIDTKKGKNMEKNEIRKGIKLEINNKYIMRDGRFVNIKRELDTGKYRFFGDIFEDAKKIEFATWSEDGKWCDIENHPYDIVRKATDEEIKKWESNNSINIKKDEIKHQKEENITDKTIEEKIPEYYDMLNVIKMSQLLKNSIKKEKVWNKLDPIEKECIEMILHKIAKFVNIPKDKNKETRLNIIIDINEYIKLIENELKKTEQQNEIYTKEK